MGDGEVIFKNYGDTEIIACPNSLEYIHDQTHSYYDQSRWIFNQFTGLLDKNKEDIYEDDILRDRFGNIGTCRYENGSLILINKCGWFKEDTGTEFEIIGNLHQNPELMT